MIEINLVPDIKQELIKSQRTRNTVVSIVIIIGVATLAIVALLAIWVFGVQYAQGKSLDSKIEEKSAQISGIDDLDNTLTIQNQLTQIHKLHSDKTINSRIFSLLTTINPPSPNDIKVTSFFVNTEEGVIKMEVQADNGYPALETLRKTINATKLQYVDENGEKQTSDLASNLSDDERSYGENAEGRRVLRFVMTFTYNENLFSPTVKNLMILAPTKSNATDSFRGIPKSLFTQKAVADEEDK